MFHVTHDHQGPTVPDRVAVEIEEVDVDGDVVYGRVATIADRMPVTGGEIVVLLLTESGDPGEPVRVGVDNGQFYAYVPGAKTTRFSVTYLPPDDMGADPHTLVRNISRRWPA
jgi:hypothetical protein